MSRLKRFDSCWTGRSLANGMTAVHVPAPDRESFYLELMIRAGSRLERPETAGAAHFLEHMMFRGSKRFPEFTALARAFESLGGEWNAATGHEHTEYSYHGIKHNRVEAMELFHEFLQNPRLVDLAVERKVILREMEGDLNEHGHSLDTGQHIAGLVWPGSSLEQPILGTRESLLAMDRETLVRFRDRHYIPANMAICAVGGEPGDETLDRLEALFGNHRKRFVDVAPEPFPPFRTGRGPAVKWVENSDNEYGVQISFPTEGEWSDKAAAYEIIGRILADGFCSRLCSRLRETLGLVYDIEADPTLLLSTGTLDISATIHPDHVDRFFPELFTILADLAVNGPTDEEMERVLFRTLVDIDLAPGAPGQFGSDLAWGSLCGQKVSLLKDRADVQALTPRRIRTICRELFHPRNAAMVILGPAEEGLEKQVEKHLVDGLPPQS
ncbi:MAG: insulinase family protein [Acidobacteria bacterium]|uniref:Insulinase family protein n=1 Tax=Candidatus Polarisedimenticola svalbardensis TaxID=2886004 RepID=A0A8J6XZE4_9BACT|nr:insulinase family protein [Candidatus Polarisedimenticola svalbardensis]